MLLQVGLCSLAACSNSICLVFVGIGIGTGFVDVGSVFIQSCNQTALTVIPFACSVCLYMEFSAIRTTNLPGLIGLPKVY